MCIHAHIKRHIQLRRCSRATIAGITRGTCPCYGIDDACSSIYFPAVIVSCICDIHIARRIHIHSDHVIQLGVRSRAAIARSATYPRTCYSGDNARG